MAPNRTKDERTAFAACQGNAAAIARGAPSSRIRSCRNVGFLARRRRCNTAQSAVKKRAIYRAFLELRPEPGNLGKMPKMIETIVGTL